MFHLIQSLYLHATSKPEYSLLVLGLDNAGKTTLLDQIKSLYPSSSSSTTTNNPNPTSPFPTTTEDNPPPKKQIGDTVPTIGQNVHTITLADSYLRIWDLGGQHSLRSLWRQYYDAAHAIVFVLDSTDLGDLANSGEASDSPLEDPPASSKGSDAAATTTTTTTAAASSSTRLDEACATLHSILTSTSSPSASASASTATSSSANDHHHHHHHPPPIPILILANKQDRDDSATVVKIKELVVRPVFESEEAGSSVRDSRVLGCSALTGRGVREAVEWVESRVRWNWEGRAPVMR